MAQRQVKEATSGELVNAIWALREEIRAQTQVLEAMDVRKKSMEEELVKVMDSQKVEQVRGEKATATITPTIVAQVKDWTRFYSFIRKHDAFHLLERRPAHAAYRELMEKRKAPVPGVESFEKRTLSIRVKGEK